jgi:hypothetical protein
MRDIDTTAVVSKHALLLSSKINMLEGRVILLCWPSHLTKVAHLWRHPARRAHKGVARLGPPPVLLALRGGCKAAAAAAAAAATDGQGNVKLGNFGVAGEALENSGAQLRSGCEPAAAAAVDVAAGVAE